MQKSLNAKRKGKFFLIYGLLAHTSKKDKGLHEVSCRIVEQPAAQNYFNSQYYSPILADRLPGTFPRMLQKAIPASTKRAISSL
jgi:hypothetical protein